VSKHKNKDLVIKCLYDAVEKRKKKKENIKKTQTHNVISSNVQTTYMAVVPVSPDLCTTL